MPYGGGKKKGGGTTVFRKRHKKKVLHNVTVHVISEGTTVARLTGNSEKPECKKRNNKNKKGILI